MPAPTITGFDTETHLIGTGCLVPKVVCLSVAESSSKATLYTTKGPHKGPFDEGSAGNWFNARVAQLFDEAERGERILVAHNLKFDLAVLCRRCPDLLPQAFRLVESGALSDTIIREKLLNLADDGNLTTRLDVSGRGHRIGYSLADLAEMYLNVSLKAEKEDEASWRRNYASLEAIPMCDWPDEAVDYAIMDAIYAVQIYNAQINRAALLEARKGFDPLLTEAFQCRVDFALYLMAAPGLAVDHDERKKAVAWLEEELRPEKTALLVDHGILRVGTPAMPYTNGAKEHDTTCDRKGTCDCPTKMKAAKKESVNKKQLFAYVERLAEGLPDDVELRYTDKGNLQVNEAWLEEFAHLDAVLTQYQHRQSLQKLVNTELPRMLEPETGEEAAVVHPNYDVLKETGRTSSYAAKITASMNIQNVHPRMRPCYVPRHPDLLMFSVDYSQMELVTFAQVCKDLFGYSVLGEKINAGIDPHAYLGAQIANTMSPEFSGVAAGLTTDDERFDLFQSWKGGDDEQKSLYKKFRTFAKPTGLGYPGGLGAKTFVAYAKSPYGVDCTVEEAKALRETWMETYPEARQYLEYINQQCQDPFAPKRLIERPDGTSYESSLYCYNSYRGMHRAGAYYCAAANGLGLQTPGAEGAKEGLCRVVRACYDETLEDDLLFGQVTPIGFIHDEIIGEVYAADGMAGARVARIAELMVEGMEETVTKDIKASAQGCLMRRWHKKAEPVFDEDGNLAVWEPKEEQ